MADPHRGFAPRLPYTNHDPAPAKLPQWSSLLWLKLAHRRLQRFRPLSPLHPSCIMSSLPHLCSDLPLVPAASSPHPSSLDPAGEQPRRSSCAMGLASTSTPPLASCISVTSPTSGAATSTHGQAPECPSLQSPSASSARSPLAARCHSCFHGVPTSAQPELEEPVAAARRHGRPLAS
ncbi:hypothetical protein ZWY2020_024188 [Hordeum vulgare]|nr:hypothetical protein ZWY2020_024188 [Hordeum vulgare]